MSTGCMYLGWEGRRKLIGCKMCLKSEEYKIVYYGNLDLDYIEKNSGIRIFGYILFSQTANYQLSLNTEYVIVHVWFSKDQTVI